MLKYNMTKGQTMIYKELYRKLQIEKHEPIKTGINSGAQIFLAMLKNKSSKIIIKTN